MLPIRVLLTACALAATLLVRPLPAQDAAESYDIPTEMQAFWKLYLPAKVADNEPDMDKAVRTYPLLAERVLDVLIDDLASKDETSLHDELRALARSLDRVKGGSRFISRVRFVLDLTPGARRLRQEVLTDLGLARELNAKALKEQTGEAWQAALDKFAAVETSLENVGDYEMAVNTLVTMADIEAQQKHAWERGQLLKRAVALADKLEYPEELIDSSRAELAKLKAAGVDPDGPKTEGPARAAPAPGAPAGTSGGHGLESFSAGSADQTFTLELNAPKKGLEPVTLPCFAPLEQYFLWPQGNVTENGPSDFDTYRGVSLKPWGKLWKLSRDGTKFSFDSNDDGKADVTFVPSSTPQRVDVPSPDGKATWPLMVSVPSDRENMFGIDVNYSPQPGSARLRFQIASSMDGKVLDDTWHVYDLNLSGIYGDAAEGWGDGITVADEANPSHWFETDAVLIGKSRLALPWSTVLPIGDGFWRATLAPDGTKVTLRQLDLASGFVKLDLATTAPATHVILREVGDLAGAYFNVVPSKKGGTVRVPAGKYQLACGRLETGHKTSMQQVCMYMGSSQPFDVAPGETHVLALGAPYKLRVQTKTEGKELVVKGNTLRVYGRGGEEWAQLAFDALQPEVEARSADGHKLGKAQKMPRAGISDWQAPEAPANTIWFPLDVRFENVKGEKLQVRVTQKSHSLLGGPFDSDWTP